MPNRLINETSPYLLQHAHNPVDWYPYGDEAFKEAQKRNCPLIISIGYSACHWCHVMEHESFSNPEIAEKMNRLFVCVKVDREERPDIDQIYINAVQLLHGQAGWPLNCFALPDGRPFWGGTYFRPQQWVEILQHLSDLYTTDHAGLLEQAERIHQGIKQMGTINVPTEAINALQLSMINEAYEQLSMRFDKIHGGTIGTPKFPMPSMLEFVLLFYYISREDQTLEHYLFTLKKMAMGGIFDQLAGGFARYSTDNEWKVPHFEKMLYDNAQLAVLYADAFQMNRNQDYYNILTKILQFIKTELTSPEGAFYAALDADSEGIEGKYYVWEKKEILNLLPEYGELLSRYWGIEKEGAWEKNLNILVRPVEDDRFAKNEHLSTEELKQLVNMASKVMLAYRNQRVRPHLDDKIIASWNAMMVKAYAHAAIISGNNEWRKTSIRAANFMVNNFIDTDGYMKRSWKAGISKINGFLGDYAFTIEAFIELYQLTFEEYWLTKAKLLTEVVLKEFSHKDSPIFWYLPEKNEDKRISSISRILETSDGVEPSGNSIMAKVLLYLGNYFEDEVYIARSASMCASMQKNMVTYPSYYSEWAIVTAMHAKGLNLIAITGPEAYRFAGQLQNQYRPLTIIAASVSESSLPVLRNKYKGHKTLLYSCMNHICQAPVDKLDDLLFQI
ncbi:MAG TPA: thioredoxin domain-containing protein [Lentimicrobium sp.]|nr:thioredoxin domain-containing protein [Lentimicrobium sp.]